MYRITGSCNRCGQCCGAPGSPNQDSPWPNNWPEAVAGWRIDVLANVQPVFTITGHPALGGNTAFAVRVGNTTYRGIWVPGHGLCKDEPPYGDTSTFSETCPFLKNQLPDNSYPCGFEGTQYSAIPVQCTRMGEYIDDEGYNEWITNHPLCSYEFEYIPD
jgi:hypothetical protein